MKILLVGLYYADNLGDAVICDCARAKLQEHFPDAEITLRDFVDRFEFVPSKGSPHRSTRKRQVKEFLRRCATRYTWMDKEYKREMCILQENIDYIEAQCREDYDALVFAGGQVIMDDLVLFAVAFGERFAQKGTPIFFNACGTGPAISPTVRKRVREHFARPEVKLISTRDSADFVNRRYCRQNPRAVNTYDPALWSSAVYGVRADPKADTIGLGIMRARSLSETGMEQFWISMIRELERRGEKWKVFVNGAAEDADYARYILSLVPELPESPEAYMAPIPGTPRELVQTVGSFRSLISFRLHSHILAASLNVPSVALVWDNKLRQFFGRIGHPERCFTVKAGPAAILDALEKAEREGYDRAELERQKQFSMELLTTAMDKELAQ